MRAEETNLWLGRKAHLVHYPLRGGTIVNVVAIVDEDFRPDAERVLVEPRRRRNFSKRVLRAGTKPRGICSAPRSNGGNGRSLDRNPLASFVAGRVALMGDAAHPMLPFLAQGAAQAIEDAGVLGEVLATAKRSKPVFSPIKDRGWPARLACKKNRAGKPRSIILAVPPPFCGMPPCARSGPKKCSPVTIGSMTRV